VVIEADPNDDALEIDVIAAALLTVADPANVLAGGLRKLRGFIEDVDVVLSVTLPRS